MGQRCSDTRAITFDNVRVPVENLIGGSESGGWINAMNAFDMSRPNIAAHATGLARAAYEHALQYSKSAIHLVSHCISTKQYNSCLQI